MQGIYQEDAWVSGGSVDGEGEVGVWVGEEEGGEGEATGRCEDVLGGCEGAEGGGGDEEGEGETAVGEAEVGRGEGGEDEGDREDEGRGGVGDGEELE